MSWLRKKKQVMQYFAIYTEISPQDQAILTHYLIKIIEITPVLMERGNELPAQDRCRNLIAYCIVLWVRSADSKCYI